MFTVKIVDTHGFSEEEIIYQLEKMRKKVIGEISPPNISRLMGDEAMVARRLTIDESKYAGIVMDVYRQTDGIYVKIKPSSDLKKLIEGSSEDTIKFSVRAWDPKGNQGEHKTIIAFDYNPFHEE